MITFEERGFAEAEVRVLEAERSDLLRSQRRFGRFMMGAVALVIVVGVPLALRQAAKERGLGILAFATMTVYAIIVLAVWVREGAAHRRRLSALDQALERRGRVKVTRCRSERVVAVEEIEDEGAEYFFEAGPSRVYYVGGQQYDLGPDFPNSDFEIVEGFDHTGTPVSFEVRCHGAALTPVRTIPGHVKLELLAGGRYPQDGDVLDCALEDVESFVTAVRPAQPGSP